jgi:hypothetical protein
MGMGGDELMLRFNHPYVGNAIGRLLVWIYSGELKMYYSFPTMGSKKVPVYHADRIFPFWMKIIGQTHGEIIFIHKDYWNTTKGLLTLPHEYVHVWQSRAHGWWGIWFMMKYVWYLIRYGYEQNPFEVAARKIAGF